MDLIGEMRRFYNEAIETAKKKNTDYAGADDPLKNFRLCEDINFCSTEEAVFVRLLDKISRIGNLLRGSYAMVSDETILDSIQDAANYLAILNAVIKERDKE